jgi:hypothetical protein
LKNFFISKLTSELTPAKIILTSPFYHASKLLFGDKKAGEMIPSGDE